jgi:predicted DNA-binding transcriptional regulator YafY
MRGDQLARQWRVLRAIEASPKGLTVAEIAHEEGVGLRTAYRDLEALQVAGFPLYTEKIEGTKRWAFVDTYRFRVPTPFTLTELMALHLYGDLFRVFKGTPFYDDLESLFKKVKSTLPPRAIAYMERIQSVFSVGIKPYREYGQIRAILNQVNRAALDRRRMEMSYHSLKREQPVARRVDPYKVWFHDGTLYLIGHCHLRGEVRMFVLDRIKALRVTEEHFDPPEDFDLDQFMKHSFKVMHDELHTVKVRISPAWARWVGEKVWHESQRAEKQPDGGLVLTFQVAGLEEIKRWVLSLGPEAEVLKPAALREGVQEELRQTMERYRGEAVGSPRRGLEWMGRRSGHPQRSARE